MIIWTKMTEDDTAEEVSVRCATHPDVETELRCGRCGKPICPRCMVYTPVGARCRDCARPTRLPTYRISAGYIVRGALAAAAAAAATGGLWAALLSRRGDAYGFLVLFLGIGIGYAVGEAVSWATNRKRGAVLQVIAAAGVVLAYLVRNLIEGYGLLPQDDLYGYVLVGLGIVVAVGRLR
ncbi:MAG: hypothetical protein QME71_01700 [Dehalococcoidia bacterium]|nr:hypothetical protein [Dehalococcoidia bacterium]